MNDCNYYLGHRYENINHMGYCCGHLLTNPKGTAKHWFLLPQAQCYYWCIPLQIPNTNKDPNILCITGHLKDTTIERWRQFLGVSSQILKHKSVSSALGRQDKTSNGHSESASVINLFLTLNLVIGLTLPVRASHISLAIKYFIPQAVVRAPSLSCQGEISSDKTQLDYTDTKY